MDNNKVIFDMNGTSVPSRSSNQFDISYVSIDERKMADFLVFTKKLSEHIGYVNNENEFDGDWSLFFDSLPFQISEIATFDSVSIHERFKELVKDLELASIESEKKSITLSLIKKSFDLFKIINIWYIKSKDDVLHLSENRLFKQLSNSIRVSLSDQLKEFKILIEKISRMLKLSLEDSYDFSDFDKIWIESEIIYDDIAIDAFQIEGQKYIKDLAVIFNTVLGFINYLKSQAPHLLEDSLNNYPYHAPHASLFIAFLKSYEHVQGDLNKVLEKHLDYYYCTVLGQKMRLSSPDKVLVYFNAADHITKVSIAKGTHLYAGIDEEGYEYRYATDHSIELNRGVITDLKIIHVAQNDFIGLGNMYKSVSNIFMREVVFDGQGRALDLTNNPKSFDSFGKDQSSLSYFDRDMSQARIGFALSSPVLILKEGIRLVTLKYKFTLKSLSALISFIEEISLEEGLSAEGSFHKVLSNIFEIRLTTEQGWFVAEKYEILPPSNWVSGEIEIQLAFDRGDPGISAYDAEIHGEGYDTNWPIIELKISSERAMFSYSFVKDLVLEECNIRVDVSNLRNLKVYSDLGILDTSVPFFPFGTTPAVGAYALIGNEEIFQKNLTDLSFNIEWHNLPRIADGFKSYYAAYKDDINNDSFQVAITGLSDYQFRPIEEDQLQKFNLFETDESDGRLKKKSVIKDINLNKLRLKPTYENLNLDNYDSTSKTGFFKFELTDPEAGFGFSSYSKLFSDAIIANLPEPKGILAANFSSDKGKAPVPTPNEPIAPQIRSLSINYSANVAITFNQNNLGDNNSFSKDQIYHLHPFGNAIIYDHGLPKQNHWLPQYNEEGYLMIGLEGLHVPLEISLYFELEDNVRNEINEIEMPTITWRYLVDNDWMDFKSEELINDGTHNFTTSGVVQLKIPTLINKNHDILPMNKYWLSASSRDHTNILSKIKLIRNNGAMATWISHKPGAVWKNNIDPYTINRLIESRNEINGVFQPYPSFGGRAGESMPELYTRVSERLRHKNRAITASSIEKIILDKFPDIFQVKCISSFSNPGSVKEGTIKVIVVPKFQSSDNFYFPKVDYYELREVQAYIEQLISPFSKVEVINTVFEKVKLTCKVQMKAKSGAGEFIKRMETDLRKFICPWFGSNQREMTFGGSIQRDDVVTYLESLDYIQYITKCSLVVIHQKNGVFSLSDSAAKMGTNNMLSCSTPWSVLIPSEAHDITLMEIKSNEMPEETKINTMKIGSDFVITEIDEDEIKFPFYDHEKDTFYAIELDI